MSGKNGMDATNDRELVGRLAADLRPVAVITRLRTRLLRFAGVGLGVGAALLAVVGVRPDLAAQSTTFGVWSSIFAGLLFVSLGATVTAFASAVPGRERPQRAGLWLLGCGLGAIALGPPATGALLGEGWTHFVDAAPPLSRDIACLVRGILFALLPAGVLFAFAASAAPLSARRTALLAGVAAVAIGAEIVHLSCPAVSVRHLWLSHGFAPLAGAALGLLGTRWLSRWRRAGGAQALGHARAPRP